MGSLSSGGPSPAIRELLGLLEMSAELPSHASVVVIGGGVMGCSALYHLARSGVADALLLERNQLTSGTTWHSAAQVRALRSTRNMTDLIRYSISLYRSLEQETGQAVGWIGKGSLSIATSPDRLTHIRRQEALARSFGLQAEFLPRDMAKERWPLMQANDVLGAVWAPDDGRVSPSDLCAALVKGARARGAKIIEQMPVTGLQTRSNRVHAVDTPNGTVRCDAVALCCGLWSREVGAYAGSAVPLYPCEHFYLLTDPVPGIEGNLPTLSDHDAHLYIRDDSGGLLVGCFEPMGKPIDPRDLGERFAFQLLAEDWDHFEPMMVNALHRVPSLADAGVRMLLNGPESFTPDGSFLLGETAETRGLFLGCGMNSVGVATGGGAGMALAHCITEGAPPMALHEVDPKRFPDCFNSAATLAARAPEVLGKHYEIAYPVRQWRTARGLRHSPLHAAWVEHGAHFGQVYGWERPLCFNTNVEPKPTFGTPGWHDQVGREVALAHEGAALFDQSTFGKIEVGGPDAAKFLNRICSNDVQRPPGRAVYSAMLNERGGIESDLVALRLSEDRYRLFVGTGSVRRDLAWLRRHVEDECVHINDVSEEIAVIGLAGPRVREIAVALGAEALLDIGYFTACKTEIASVPVEAVRLSYVGEAGWELNCKSPDASSLYLALYAAGARPAGLLARTSMRIEKRFLAYGHDIDTDVSPLQAGIEFAVAWNTSFIGKDALMRERDKGTQNRIVTLVFEGDERTVPLGNEPVYVDGELAGRTTSASYGYRVGRALALADLGAKAPLESGTAVEVDIAGKLALAKIVHGPVFDPAGARMRA